MRKYRQMCLMDMDCEWTQMVKEDGIRDSSWVSSWVTLDGRREDTSRRFQIGNWVCRYGAQRKGLA